MTGRPPTVFYKKLAALDNELIVRGENHNVVVVCFGGMAAALGGIPVFEFSKHLGEILTTDLMFYIDKAQAWYHLGIEGISSNIDETAEYLKSKIAPYNKVVFMGTSAGGYAAILFGSLLSVDNVIAFTPRTILTPARISKVPTNSKSFDDKYKDLKPHINPKTQYHIHGCLFLTGPDNDHHISHCLNIKAPNVEISTYPRLVMTDLRDSGDIQTILATILDPTCFK